MAISGPAVSKSAKSWEEFKKINSELENYFERLTRATVKAVEKIYEDYCERYSEYLPNGSMTTQQVQAEFKEMVDGLKGELEKALSKNVNIAFVGRTSGGKSSLINALLRVKRLPVDTLTATMCTFKVRPTPAKEWSVIEMNRGEDLLNKGNQEEVDKLLSLFTDDDYIEKRKELNITFESVIQVNWPRNLCNLPENIILIDTPGIEESDDCDQVVIDLCKKADIIVAVMDLTSPSLKITGMVNQMKNQLTLGVFTKWDIALEEKVEKRRQNVRNNYETKFVDKMERKSKVYFVDGKHIIDKGVQETVTEREGTEDFLRFERELAESAKTVKAQKGVAFIEEAEQFASKFTRYLETFGGMIDKTKSHLFVHHQSPIQEKISTLTSERNSLHTLREEVQRLDVLINSYISDGKIDQLIKEICNTIEGCSSGPEEDEAFFAFLENVSLGIDQFLNDESERVNEKYRKWRDGVSSKHLRKSLSSYATGRLPRTGNYGYNENFDPYSYVTNNTFWAAVAVCGTALASTALVPTVGVGAATAVAVEGTELAALGKAVGAAVGAAVGFRATMTFTKVMEFAGGICPGTVVRRMFGASSDKKRKIKEYIRKVLITFGEKCAGDKGSPRREIDEISETISEEIKMEEIKLSKIATEKLNPLKEWSEKLTEYKQSLQKFRRELDQRKHRWTEKDTVPSDDQTENQSPVQLVEKKL